MKNMFFIYVFRAGDHLVASISVGDKCAYEVPPHERFTLSGGGEKVPGQGVKVSSSVAWFGFIGGANRDDYVV